MTNMKLFDLLWKLKFRVEVLGADALDAERLMRDAAYRSERLQSYAQSDDALLSQLAKLALERDTGGTLVSRAPASRHRAFAGWIIAHRRGLMGAVIFLMGAAGVIFVYKDRQSASAPPPAASAHLPVEKPTILLRLHGSNTEGAKLAPPLAKAYLERLGATETVLVQSDEGVERYVQGYLPETQDAVAVEIFTRGSRTSFQDLGARQADIGMSSRPITAEEREALRPQYGDLTAEDSEIVIGLDGLAIIVHAANSIESLTVDQLAALFSGKISDWSRVGGPAGQVSLHARDDLSGTYDTFNHLVLRRHRYPLSDGAQRYESDAALADAVAKDPNGLGFVGLPYVGSTKVIAVADAEDTRAIPPTPFAVRTEDYPLTRRLFFYAPQRSDNPHVRAFIDFTLSDAGRTIVDAVGFISQHLSTAKPALTPDMPPAYVALTQDAERLSLNFRFQFGSAALDNKAKRDSARLLNYMKGHPHKELLLLGFADRLGPAEENRRLSLVRARVVEDNLARYGLPPKLVQGFGEVLPVASSDTPEGRHKNRRVEVWVR